MEFKNPTPKATFAPAARGGCGCQQTCSASGQSVLLQHTESVFESRSDRTVFSLGERKGFVFVFGCFFFFQVETHNTAISLLDARFHFAYLQPVTCLMTLSPKYSSSCYCSPSYPAPQDHHRTPPARHAELLGEGEAEGPAAPVCASCLAQHNARARQPLCAPCSAPLFCLRAVGLRAAQRRAAGTPQKRRIESVRLGKSSKITWPGCLPAASTARCVPN